MTGYSLIISCFIWWRLDSLDHVGADHVGADHVGVGHAGVSSVECRTMFHMNRVEI